MNADSPAASLNRMISGYWLTQMVYVAARLGLADLLKTEPRSVQDLAAATDTHAPSLYRLMRALASVGVFREVGDRRFALTPQADLLRSDHPHSARALAIMSGEEHYQAWGQLLYSVKTGQKAFDKIYGQPVFDYLANHPEQAANFDAAMVGVHGRESAEIVQAYDWTGVATLVDVGGGNGSLLQTVLQKLPSARGVVLDLPNVVERARTANTNDRLSFVAGNFFEAIPVTGDVFMMRHIIHDWTDEQCVTILRNIRRAIGQTSGAAKLLVLESVIPRGNDPFFGKLLDLTMLTIPGGMERTDSEYRSLLVRGGFELTRIIPTPGEVSIIEALPA
jgi:hypothetical protein